MRGKVVGGTGATSGREGFGRGVGGAMVDVGDGTVGSGGLGSLCNTETRSSSRRGAPAGTITEGVCACDSESSAVIWLSSSGISVIVA